MDALVGHTGFVGGTLARQHAFGAKFNSRTMDDSAGCRFATLVCAAAPGSMFDANRRPEADREAIETLMAQLGRIQADRVVLVSTIACLAGFAAASEDTADFETAVPYGVHRRMLEEFVADRFADALIVRLPALFGPGLKKNFLFDIMNPMPSMLRDGDFATLEGALGSGFGDLLDRLYRPDPGLGLRVIDRDALAASGQRSELETATAAAGLAALRFTNRESRFQFYDMGRLWRDIAIGLRHGHDVLHLAPVPLRAGDVFARLTGREMPETQARLHREDMRTRHAALWDQHGAYIAERDEVLDAIATFVSAETARA